MSENDTQTSPTATQAYGADITPSPWSRVLGCLLGGAVGDALGAPVEFMRRAEILERFGPAGIAGYATAYCGLGKITDDTQMTLFTAEGLLRGWASPALPVDGATPYRTAVAEAYLYWLATQREPARITIDLERAPGWLFQQSALHNRRAPGYTCIGSLRSMKQLHQLAHNDSKGCGGVMRVAPAGLLTWAVYPQAPEPDAFTLAAECAALTHGHPSGYLAAGAFATAIAGLAAGLSLTEALALSKDRLSQERDHEETLGALQQAARLAQSGTAPEYAIAELGEGWVAEEALAISFYCALQATDFRSGILAAVNHDGDSDSTGAITGQLLGALWGHTVIPEEWLAHLELREVITEIAADLHRLHVGHQGKAPDAAGQLGLLRDRYRRSPENGQPQVSSPT